MDKKIDAESQALWDELRRCEPSLASTNPCCQAMKSMINSFSPLPLYLSWKKKCQSDELKVFFVFCPQCGRRL